MDTYQDIQLEEVAFENVYETPSSISVDKEAEGFSKRNMKSTEKKNRYSIIIFIAILAAVSLALALALFTAQHFTHQTDVSQHSTTIDTLMSNISTISELQTLLLDQKLAIEQRLNYTEKEFLSFKEQFELIPKSCRYLSTNRPSEYYLIILNDEIKVVYCDTSRTSCSCDTTGGWMRVANIDMTDPNQQCPSEFKTVTRTQPPFRTCGRPDGLTGCLSTTFPVHGIEYSRVCGRVQAYQFGRPDAFLSFLNGRATSIDSHYVDGVSLTHGQSPRQHIWTFAAADYETSQLNTWNKCPCTNFQAQERLPALPSFVGPDYFCDTATYDIPSIQLHPGDPLWDGQGCGGNSTCCEFNNPPWFCKQLPQPTTDDIEMRICGNAGNENEDVLLQLVNIYVQ